LTALSDKVHCAPGRPRSSKIMITFNITGFLADFTNGEHKIVVDDQASTVGEALQSLWRKYVGLRDRVLNEQGHLRPHVNIFLNDDNVRLKQLLDTPVQDNCEITILPAVSGGA
jgi:molybdopterin synthase sulfur carrier subunit